MPILVFGNYIITLYDDYITLYEQGEERKILKEEIEHMFLNDSSSSHSYRAGSVGCSVRVAKGVYVGSSTPYYKTNTINSCNPTIHLKNGERIRLVATSNIGEFSKYSENVMKFNMWLKSSSLTNYKLNNVVREQEMKKEKKRENTMFGFIFAWFIALIISIFSGNGGLFSFLVVGCPIIWLVKIFLEYALKNKK